MNCMGAIYRRELSTYFKTPIGYIFIAAFYLFAGFYFFAGTLFANTTDITPVFTGMFTIVLFLIPLLTMRLLSEDKRNKTDQALLTAPIRLSSIVLGKFLAAVTVYLIALSITFVYGLIVAAFAPPSWYTIVGNFAGLLLLGLCLIAIGLFISSLTENQLIAAIGGFGVALLLILTDSVNTVISVSAVRSFLYSVSFYRRYTDFTYGLFPLSGVVFYLSLALGFLFLTARVLERRRWAS